MVPRDGVEPPTRGFSVHCSTTELTRPLSAPLLDNELLKFKLDFQPAPHTPNGVRSCAGSTAPCPEVVASLHFRVPLLALRSPKDEGGS